jgi:DNA mismatch repair protein MutS2
MSERSFAHPLVFDAADDLEWPRLLEALAERCTSVGGGRLARELSFAATAGERGRVESLHREACDLLRRGAPLPLGDVPDMAAALERLRAGSVLDASELRSFGRLLEDARVLRRFLAAHAAVAPTLLQAYGTDPTLDRVAERLADAFDADGTLSDRASPRLAQLRGDYRASRERLVNRLQDAIAKHAAIVQDAFITEREGRFVVPIRSDAHERFQGIVHGSSSSGATLFVEPRAVVPLGNRLKVLEGEVEGEVQAVLAGLTERLADVLPSVVGAVRALAEADLRGAVARLAADLSLEFPRVVDEVRLELKRARHPLLLLRQRAVVPSDLSIRSGAALVISGPNAGGKTVALKTLGLALLLVRAGLPIAADPESEVGLFDRVLTDVGDAQNLANDLSTFSAHVKNLVAILDAADDRTLVLLDEVAGGTDPKEGEALAAGLLDSLCLRGAAVVVTTHYEGLKALALGDPRFTNASVGFDFTTMTPTFRVAIGIPGRSSALAVARRYGMPGVVIERAERFLSTEEVAFEVLVEKLQRERAAVDMARDALEEKLAAVEREREELRRAIDEAKARDRAALEKELDEFRQRLRSAKEELRHGRERAKQKGPEAQREAEQVLERLSREVAIGGTLDRLPEERMRVASTGFDASRLQKGARVYVGRLRADAEVLEVLAGGQVRVMAGALKLVVDARELAPARSTREEPVAAKPSGKGARGAKSASPAGGGRVYVRTSETTCDLRGMRTDDALVFAASFVDRLMQRGDDAGFLLHGHGTGALKEALRRELSLAQHVRLVRAADQEEGGDAFTVVVLH